MGIYQYTSHIYFSRHTRLNVISTKLFIQRITILMCNTFTHAIGMNDVVLLNMVGIKGGIYYSWYILDCIDCFYRINSRRNIYGEKIAG